MEPILYKITRPILTFLMKVIYRPKYIGVENIPKDSNFILGGNHTNYLDCLLIISSTKKTVHFLAKDSLLKGWKKLIFKNMGIIPVNRSIHDKSALNHAIDSLNNGKVIGIFPEGTINRTKDYTLPFKIGCIKMAHDTNTPIIPFVITGKYKLLKNDLTIEFLKPINKINDNLTAENNKFMNIISTKLEEKRK